jgi:hypothetical protein
MVVAIDEAAAMESIAPTSSFLTVCIGKNPCVEDAVHSANPMPGTGAAACSQGARGAGCR